MINFIQRAGIILLGMITLGLTHAAPLKVGITNFSPPFVMRGANKEAYGFDVDMMTFICKALNRPCEFQIMRFNELIPAVNNNTVDVAIGSITITGERAKIVNFSLPYLLSYARFLEKKSDNPPPFTLEALNGKTIGIVAGSIFADQIKHMEIKDPVIKDYDKIEELLEALSSEKVDAILLDSPTSAYWEANSSGAFMKVGPPYLYGYGLGIAANPTVVSDINKAIIQYQSSPDFKLNYNKYISPF